MIGQIVVMPTHRGTSFTSNGVTYALCNGQSFARNAYASLSLVWPSGAYGSTNTTITLPNFAGGFYFRGADLSRGVDPGVTSRTSLSGVLPSGSSVGSFQAASLESHSHPSGYQNLVGNTATPGGDTCLTTISFAETTSNPVILNSSAGTSGAVFDFKHQLVYPYIALN